MRNLMAPSRFMRAPNQRPKFQASMYKMRNLKKHLCFRAICAYLVRGAFQAFQASMYRMSNLKKPCCFRTFSACLVRGTFQASMYKMRNLMASSRCSAGIVEMSFPRPAHIRYVTWMDEIVRGMRRNS